MAKCNPWKVVLLVVAVVVYITMSAFNALAGTGPSMEITYFTPPLDQVKGTKLDHNRGPFVSLCSLLKNVSDKYRTDFTPAGWTFGIWGVIYLWQALWIIYSLTGLCRRKAQAWIHSVVPYPFFIIWIINNLFNIGWIFLWDREYLITALVFLALIAFTNYTALFFSYYALNKQGPWLQKHSKVDLWLVRILVQNGIVVYATWPTIATLLNFAIELTYSANVDIYTSGTVALSILAFQVVLWYVLVLFCLENFVLDKYVHYTLTVYPVVIVALSGFLNNNFNINSPSRNNIYIGEYGQDFEEEV
ncbi:uncharacterized protein LOC103175372 [Callorhinchus milii]|uniref:uncharacterized protein LOC103175372 n=1 Tax=Callorhinchus milii TaxID=7868 RepID=UPI001C3F5C1C|nr:uncharacterized protein LOC103175372 [Callorhinchus milii]